MFQAVARERGTINYVTQIGGLRGRWAARNMIKLQYKRLHEGSCAMKGYATQHSQKVTIRVTIHDLTSRRWLREVSG